MSFKDSYLAYKKARKDLYDSYSKLSDKTLIKYALMVGEDSYVTNECLNKVINKRISNGNYDSFYDYVNDVLKENNMYLRKLEVKNGFKR